MQVGLFASRPCALLHSASGSQSESAPHPTPETGRKCRCLGPAPDLQNLKCWGQGPASVSATCHCRRPRCTPRCYCCYSSSGQLGRQTSSHCFLRALTSLLAKGKAGRARGLAWAPPLTNQVSGRWPWTSGVLSVLWGRVPGRKEGSRTSKGQHGS